MNLGEIKRRVKATVGDEAGVLITDNNILDWANDAQNDIVRKTKCLQGTFTVSMESGVASYDGPTDLLTIEDATLDGLNLRKTTLEYMNENLPDRDQDTVSTGTPIYVWKWGNKLNFWPRPSAAGTDNFVLSYTYRAPSLHDDVDIPSIPVEMHEDIVRYCIAQALELNEDHGPAANVKAEYEQRVASARADTEWPYQDTYPSVRPVAGDW